MLCAYAYPFHPFFFDAIIAKNAKLDMMLNTLKKDPIEKMLPKEPIEPIENADPLEPMDRKELVDHKDNTEFFEPILKIEFSLSIKPH